jgi:hypothetical protein
LEDLYNSLKTSLQEKKVIQKTGQCWSFCLILSHSRCA